MRLKKFSLIPLTRFLCHVVCLVGVHTLAIADMAGQVTAIMGNVNIISPNTTRPVFKGDLIYSNDVIHTLNNDSKAQVLLTDGTTLIIHPESQLSIQDYVFSKEQPTSNRIILQLKQGSLRAVNGEIAKSANATLNTPIGHLISKQSDYSITLQTNALIMSVQQGVVHFQNTLGETLVNQGQSFQFSTQIPPIPTQKLALDSFIIEKTPKNQTPFINQDTSRPRLENYPNYNKFLQAMYLYRKAAEDKIKPRIIFDKLPDGQLKPEQSTIDGEYDITQWDIQLSNIMSALDSAILPPISSDNHAPRMNLLSVLEMEYASVDDALNRPSFLLSDIIDMSDKELVSLLKTDIFDDSDEKKKKEELLMYLLKKNMRIIPEGNAIQIIGLELGQPDITVISRP